MRGGPSSGEGEGGPGVPEAIPRVLRVLRNRLDAGTVDRIWIFPPLVKGRREWGLVVASRMVPGDGSESEAAEEERRRLYSAPYTAERTGRALHLDVAVAEQGEAPPDRLPRVMDGVVRRSGDELGDPREIRIEGDPARYDALMDEFDPALLEEEAVPMPTGET